MNIYVGNLPFSSTDEDLKSMFSEHGNVESAKVIVDRESGRSKGFGFVEMSDNAARKAIEILHETEYEGKQISVNEARPKTDNRNGGRNFERRPW
jgi:RNA recognition motif-containing protein